MNVYSLTQIRNQHGEVFDKAQVEPVLVTKQKRPSHVILSAQAYQKLIARLEELEDRQLAEAADKASSQSELVGSEAFTAALEKLSHA
ncbi:MAG: type II toxin-antitoxin system Phd/YefM family antitoxin [Waterburya sp.]